MAARALIARVIAVAVPLVYPCFEPCLAATPQRGLTAWQEIVVLTLAKLDLAVAHCGFKLNGKQVGLLVDSSGLSAETARSQPRPSAIQQQIDAAASAYDADQATACARAWDDFGADGQARDFLVQ